MKTLAIAAFAAATLLTVQSAANAGWGCRGCDYSNGPKLTGISLGNASAGTVSTVILPSGETLDLR